MTKRQSVSERCKNSGSRSEIVNLYRDDSRAVSATVNYVLALAITAILISGLLIAASGYMESQRTTAIGNALDVQTEQLAKSIGEIDRLASSMETNGDGEARIAVNLQDSVIDRTYRITVVNKTEAGDQRKTYQLAANSNDINRSVRVRTSQSIVETTVQGGPVVIRFDPATDHGLVIESGERV